MKWNRRAAASVRSSAPILLNDYTLMTEWNTDQLIAWDKRFVWHPFTNMREWCAAKHEPLVLVEGRGALLRDSRGREYIDGNSSIWTNIHGHNHPHINAAIRRQLSRVPPRCSKPDRLGGTFLHSKSQTLTRWRLFPRPR